MDAIERKVASLTALNGVLRSENADLRQRLAEADDGRGEEDEELADLQAEFATRIGQADKQLAELRDDRDRLRQELRGTEAAGAAHASQLAQRDARIEKLQGESKQLRTRVQELERSERQLQQEAKGLRGGVSKREDAAAALEARVTTLQERLARAESDQAAVRSDAAEQVADAQRRQADAEAALAAAHAQHDADAAAHTAAQQSGLSSEVAALRAALTEARERAALREDALQATVADLSAQLSTVQASSEGAAVAVLEATQPLMRQAEQLAQQLADAEDEHRHALAALRTELASAHNAADAAHAAAERAAERAAAATDAAERDVRDAQAACSSKDGFVKELQGKLAAMQDERTEWEAERAELAAAIRAAEDTREAAVQRLQRDVIGLRRALSELEEQAGAAAAPDIPSPAGAVVIVPPARPPPSGSPNGASALNLPTRQTFSGGSIGTADDEIAHALVREIMSGNGAEAERAARSAELPVSTLGDAHSVGPGVAQLQEALVRLERERDAVSAELLQALARIRSLESAAVDAHRAGGEGQQLQEQVDLAMEVLGERNARIEELEEDVQAMKKIFREQLEEAMHQLSVARGATGLA